MISEPYLFFAEVSLDLSRGMLLAHKASAEAAIAVDVLAGKPGDFRIFYT